jgi:hypothetical protein
MVRSNRLLHPPPISQNRQVHKKIESKFNIQLAILSFSIAPQAPPATFFSKIWIMSYCVNQQIGRQNCGHQSK